MARPIVHLKLTLAGNAYTLLNQSLRHYRRTSREALLLLIVVLQATPKVISGSGQISNRKISGVPHLSFFVINGTPVEDCRAHRCAHYLKVEREVLREDGCIVALKVTSKGNECQSLSGILNEGGPTR